MSSRSFFTKVIFLVLFSVLFFQLFSVKAADPLSSTVTYNSNNSLTVQTSPSMSGSVALYYKKENGDIDGVFGSTEEELAAQTCSSGTCINANIEFGIVKVYVPTEKWLKIQYFHKSGGSITIMKEEVYPDIEPNDLRVASTLGSPPDNVLLQLSLSEEEWLKAPAAVGPTLTETPTPTITNTPTLTPTAIPGSPTVTLSPSPTPANPVSPPACSPGTGYVNETIAINQTTQLDGLPVPAYRSNTSYGYGIPDALYFSLGVNGSVTYKFTGVVNNIAGVDFSIYEETLGRSTYPEETATVEVSADGVTWFTLPTLARGRSPLGVTGFDITTTGLGSFQYIRVTDIKNPANLNLEYDGFDINAIVAVSQDCITPSPTPTSTITPTPSQTTPTLSPSPTPADPTVPPVCSNTGGVNETIAVTQTVQRDGLPVPAYRSNTSYGYGSPDLVYYTMGIGGTVTYKFPGVVTDIPGIDFNIFEDTLGRSTYPEERASIEISQDGITWFTLPVMGSSRSPLGVTGFDISSTGLIDFQYIRLTDIANPANLNPESDGFDINAIVANSQNCPIITPTVTPTPSPTGTSGLLTIQKTNNRVGQNVSPGGNVTYTMKVTVNENVILADRGQQAVQEVQDVQVVDLPPNGFNYAGGSWTAQSTIRGDLKAGGTTTEPTYHSPGTWKLGTMMAGEVVTLTYKANINGDVDGGVYTDLAWAQGNSAAVLSQGISSSYMNDEFVGTEVAIVKNIQTTASIDVKRTENKTKEEVLGASTGLPRTGTSNIWVMVATIILLSGFGFVGMGAKMLSIRGSDRPSRKIKRNFKVFRFIVQIMVVVGLFTVLVTEVNAAAFTTIRISLPQDRNNSNFKISFVTLDSENRQITVKCFKKGPGEGSFIQFGSDIVLAPGGNSGTCNVDTSVVGTNGAAYQFMASAQASGGSVVNSQVVGTSFSNASPETPINYSKQQNGCNYKISFKTANDGGRTKKVEIYRSENTSFTADGGTKVGEVAANSNEDKSFDNSADCGKRYFFVIRAFDDFGNGSGLTGDSEVTVNTTTTTTGGGTTAGGAIAVAAGQGNVGAPGAAGQGQGAVQGANEGTSPTPASDEAVLGATNEADTKAEAEEGWRKYLLWIIIGLAVAGAGYVFIAKRS